MNAHEIELWTRDTIMAVRSGQPNEDSRIELKSTWIAAEKAAKCLAGHANAARGAPILWIIGIDEKARALTNITHLERESWYTSVQKHFDGFAPRLSVDANVRIEEQTVVALYFETDRESPYVVKTSSGGFPEFIVPWREGTRVRAARRDELLRILVPVRRLSALVDELDFDSAVVNMAKSVPEGDTWGCLFRDEEFRGTMTDGAMRGLPDDVKQKLYQAYVLMGRANQLIHGALNTSMAGSPGAHKRNDAKAATIQCLPVVEVARAALLMFMQGNKPAI